MNPSFFVSKDACNETEYPACATVRSVGFGAGQTLSPNNIETLLILKWYKIVHFVSQATNKLDSIPGRKNINVLQGRLELGAQMPKSHFPTRAPNLVWTDSEKHGLYGHGSNIIMKYLLLYLISGWAQGHCEPKFHAHHSGLEFVCLQCIASGRRVLAPFRALPKSPQLGKR